MPTIEIDEEARSRLLALRDEIERETGQSPTLGEIVSALAADAYESNSESVGTFHETGVPLSKEERERMQRGRFRSDTETEEEDIDEVLYGTPDHEQ